MTFYEFILTGDLYIRIIQQAQAMALVWTDAGGDPAIGFKRQQFKKRFAHGLEFAIFGKDFIDNAIARAFDYDAVFGDNRRCVSLAGHGRRAYGFRLRGLRFEYGQLLSFCDLLNTHDE